MPSTPTAPGPSPSSCSRRSLLRTGVLGAGAAAVLAAGTGTGAPAAAATQAPAVAPAPMQNLFTLADLDFDTLFAFGGTGYGSAEFGELARAVDRVNQAGASYQTYDTFRALAQRAAAQASQELAAGRRTSARSGYLRAASYYDLCLYFILATTDRAQETSAYAAMQRCWQQASQLSDPPFEPVKIPYRGSWMPGYLLRPDAEQAADQRRLAAEDRAHAGRW